MKCSLRSLMIVVGVATVLSGRKNEVRGQTSLSKFAKASKTWISMPRKSRRHRSQSPWSSRHEILDPRPPAGDSDRGPRRGLVDRNRLETKLRSNRNAEQLLDSLWPSWRDGRIPETLNFKL